jgi:hypothetical protein
VSNLSAISLREQAICRWDDDGREQAICRWDDDGREQAICRWNDDGVGFVLLSFYSVSSLK